MSKHLKDFHSSAAQQTTPHPGVQADDRQQVARSLRQVADKIADRATPSDDDLNTLCEILYLAEVGPSGRGPALGRKDC